MDSSHMPNKSAEIDRLKGLIGKLILPQDQQYVNMINQQITEHKKDIMDARPVVAQIEGLEAAMSRKQDKRTKLLDTIATSQLEVAMLEAKLTEEQRLLTDLKNKHMQELRAHLPQQPPDPSIAAMASMTAQVQAMMRLLGQIAGTPGIDPTLAATIAQVVPCHPVPGSAAVSPPAQVSIAATPPPGAMATQVSTSTLAQVALTPTGAPAQMPTPLTINTLIGQAVPMPPPSWEQTVANAAVPDQTAQQFNARQAQSQLVGANAQQPAFSSMSPLLPSQLALASIPSPPQEEAAGRAAAIGQAMAGKSPSRERSPRRIAPADDSEEDDLAIISVSLATAQQEVSLPQQQLFLQGGQDA